MYFFNFKINRYLQRNQIFQSQQYFYYMESLRKKYMTIIEGLYRDVSQSHEYENQRDKILNQKYKTVVLQEVSKANGKLNVVMDKQFAQALLQKLFEAKKIPKRRFKEYEKRIQFIISLSRIVTEQKFISKRDKMKIDIEISKIKNQLDFKLRSRLTLLEGSDGNYQFRNDFFETIGMDDVDGEDDEESSNAYKKFYEMAMKEFEKQLLVKIDDLIGKFEDKKVMLEKQLCDKIDESLKNMAGRDDQEIEINKMLTQMAVEESLDANHQHKQKIQQKYQYLKSVLDKFSGLKIFNKELNIKLVLAKFGSNVSGFASKNTDMDLTILTDCYIDEKGLLRTLHKFFQAEFKQKFQDRDRNYCKIELRQMARIPLIKINFEEKGFEMHFDIIINNILGVINSKFLSVYGGVPWIRNLGILIKMWGKNNQLVNENKFSSYSLNLLMINYLNEKGMIKLVMDARNRQADAPHFVYKRNMKGQMQVFNVYYQFNSDSKNITSEKRVNLCQLLTGFFGYYQKDGAHWKLDKQQQIVTVDGSKKKDFDDDFIFTMRDPFDEKHNPGRVKKAQINNVLQKFTDAARILRQKNKIGIQNLFRGD